METHRPVDSITAREWTRPKRVPNGYRAFPGEPHVVLLYLRGGPVWFDRRDLSKVRRYHWHRNGSGYVYGAREKEVELEVSGDLVPMGTRTERVLLSRLLLPCREGEVVLQKNRDKRDFRSINLLAVDRPEFVRWRNVVSPPRRAGYKGIWRKVVSSTGRVMWVAEIDHDYLGIFATEDEAARTYDLEAYARYGPAAYFNFPEEIGGREEGGQP